MPTPADEPDIDFSNQPFEQIYAAVGADLSALPWSKLAPRAELMDWLQTQPPGPGRSALVVGCGVGDDAAGLAALGYAVTAFDVSPTAIEWCRRRFAGTGGVPIDFRVADLFELPAEFSRRFDVVVEINTIQSLPVEQRAAVVAAIADTVAPGGRIFVRAAVQQPADPPASERPWPLLRGDLDLFQTNGLQRLSLPTLTSPGWSWEVFQAIFQRPATELPTG
jgi:SAM-dependent methyltransferase